MNMNKRYLLVATRPEIIHPLAPLEYANLDVRLVLIDDETQLLKALTPFKTLLPRECKAFTDFIIYKDKDGLLDAIDLSNLPSDCSREDILKASGFNDLLDA